MGSALEFLIQAVDEAHRKHLLGEVPSVETGAKDTFIDGLELGHGELLVQQVEADGLEVYILFQPFMGGLKDTLMIECQGRYLVEREPFGIGGIVSGDDLVLVLTYQGEEGDGDDTLAGVAVNSGEGLQLLDIDVSDTGLLKEFTQGSLFCGLVHTEEAAGQGPFSLVGLYSSFYKEHAEPLAIEAEDDTVGGHGGMGILVTVVLLFCFCCGTVCNRAVKTGCTVEVVG